MGEDILSVIFLILIFIIISAIIYKNAPAGWAIPTIAVAAACMWIAFDYMMLKKYNAMKTCAQNRGMLPADDIETRIKQLAQEIGESYEGGNDDVDNNIDNNQMENDEPPTALHKNEFDIKLYDRQATLSDIHKEMGCSADNRLANRMKYAGMQAKMSKDIRARWNVEKFRPYVEEELRENEKRHWWENDADFLDAYM